MTNAILAITERTNAEWPADHPLRARVVVLTDDELLRAGVLVCSIEGEERLPPAADDHDIPGRCDRCRCGIVYRASAPRFPKRVCGPCWIAITKGTGDD